MMMSEYEDRKKALLKEVWYAGTPVAVAITFYDKNEESLGKIYTDRPSGFPVPEGAVKFMVEFSTNIGIAAVPSVSLKGAYVSREDILKHIAERGKQK